MKKTYYTLIAFILLVSASGCKKFLDINKDPNNPVDVQEALILTPLEIYTTTNIIGGFPGSVSAYWTQQLAINQPAPEIDSYRITPSDVNNTWSFDLYPAIFYNSRLMIDKAEKAGNNGYAGIGKVLLAYNLAVCTDLWGDIPYTEGFAALGNLKPKYDSQESIYKLIQTTLDQAIVILNSAPAGIRVGSDDLIYGGDFASWKKLAYTLKARYHLRLSKAAGYSATTQADLALAALQNGFSANADNAKVTYSGKAKGENPWYQGTLPGAGGVVLSKNFVDLLKANNDPRLPILAAPGSGGDYVGRQSGTIPTTDPTIYAAVSPNVGGYIADDEETGKSAPVYLATYAEALFIKAEATLNKSGAVAAQPVLKAAIEANMDLLKVAAADKNAYTAIHSILDPVTPLKTLINEKYVASFLSLEAYNDWRRTGFPVLNVVPNAFRPYIPQRYPYPSQEVTSNPQPQQSIPTSEKVWWAK
ncbi:SusD/RagB family nutrient-binding outer membrane lipoprotein [Pedobacter sp. KBW06]|uniref:SusD/RagB family nutrient-binding outer membrane lipoprotein n=1 Tax=Pedobacter sp. KBW06 TaxID=2153359 RepID=UPI000F5B4406|nr:SusD/RagB family nutrient-binding outer membrane lipoprotein [Pedobacter sp. KBW06]RQO66322.1 SusD/RagB family nutrient-binding outer membrane lipoprotein [Pedobacter sp. KBW06]